MSTPITIDFLIRVTQLRSPGQIAQPLWVTHEPLPALDADVDEGAAEGSVLRRLRLVRERDPALRKQKIDAVLAASGELACEVCRFDFESFYGERGKGFAEVHHAVPLHVTGPTSTRLTDLVVLCSNCHRMIHRGKDWLTPAQLVQAVETQTSNAHRT